MNWTRLNSPTTSRPSYITRSLVTRVSVTAWLAATRTHSARSVLSLHIANESVPYTHSAGCLGWPPAVLEYKYIFQNKINEINFIKQHSETVVVWNYQNADCSLKNKLIVSFVIIFGTLSFPMYSNVAVYTGVCKLELSSSHFMCSGQAFSWRFVYAFSSIF